jgi:predicted permease
MRLFGTIYRKLIALFRRRRLEQDLDDELAFHVAMREAEHVQKGMDLASAQMAARREFGNVTLVKEHARDTWILPSLESWRQDVQYAVRTLTKTPTFSLVAILTIALGIGATTAIFSLVNGVLIRPLPIGQADRLLYIGVWNPRLAKLASTIADIGVGSLPPSYPDFRDMQRATRTLSSFAMFDQSDGNLATADIPIRINVARVTGDFFRTLDVSPEWGRTLDTADERGERGRVAVISHELMSALFGTPEGVLQRTIRFKGQTFQIVGVMPSGFTYPGASDRVALGPSEADTDLWIPMTLTPEQQRDREFSDADAAIGRLRPGVSLADAQVEMKTLMARLDPLHQADWRGWYPIVKSFRETTVGRTRPLMSLLFGAALFVLLIACGNAAHLLLARASSRAHEMAIRAALGAGRGRLVRQLLTEAALLAGTAGVLGVMMAYAAVRVIPFMNPGTIPRLAESSVDSRVLLFAGAASLLTAVLFGLFPAMVASREATGKLLGRHGRGMTATSQPARRVLIVMEVALAVVLLSGATLLIRSYVNLQHADRGFSASTVTLRVRLDGRYGRPEQRRTFFRTLLDDVRNLPGIEAAGAVSALPLSGSEGISLFLLENYANRQDQLVNSRQVTAEYFDAMGMKLVEGRLLTDEDITGRPPVVMVNQAFVRAYFNGQRAIGRKFRTGGVGTPDEERAAIWSTIIGVVSDVRHTKLEQSPPPEVYSPYWQGEPRDSLYIAVRARSSAADTAARIRKTIYLRDPNLAIGGIQTMDDLISQAGAPRRFQTGLLVGFAGLALTLAAVGLYGLLAYMVKQRTAEIGVRVAIGAQRADIVSLVLGEGIVLTSIGIGVGTIGALGLTQLLNTWLYGITRTDPFSYGAVVLVLSSVSLTACSIPAIRACSVDPMIALRSE